MAQNIQSSLEISKLFNISENEVRARRTALLRARWKTDFEAFCRQRVKIRDKQGQLVPLILNDAQKKLISIGEQQIQEDGWCRVIGCKGRRQGFSTVVEARGYWRTSLWSGYNVYVQAHIADSSDMLFGMVKTAWNNDPMREATSTDNAKVMQFMRNGSRYTVATAGSKGGGRGGAVSYLHASEAAWYKDAVSNLAAAVQSVDEVRGVWGVLWKEPANPLPFEKGVGVIEGWVIPPSEIWIESTSAGNNGVFYDMFMDALKGKGRYRHAFIPWTLQPEYCDNQLNGYEPSGDVETYGDGNDISEKEYMSLNGLTIGQMKWRHDKITELRSLEKFQQEYPLSIEEAFSAGNVDDLIIKPSAVLRARKRTPIIVDAPLIIGVDPASGGGDRFAYVARRGQRIEKWQARNDLDPKESCDWMGHVIDELNPDEIIIDNGNLGATVAAFLKHYNPRYENIIRTVNFGGTSQLKLNTPSKAGAINRRAEMYSRLRDWLDEGGCIPDNDVFATDLSANRIVYRTSNDWLLMAKKDLKKMGIKSPDIGDALACTFAYKTFFDTYNTPKTKTLTNNAASGNVAEHTYEIYGANSWQV